ncbi:RNA-directed DNA polymerase, eukaryota, reverse transcriptase zinc-binding domain protein [Tanacetum coccineum]
MFTTASFQNHLLSSTFSIHYQRDISVLTLDHDNSIYHEHTKPSQVELLVVDEATAIPLPAVKPEIADFHQKLPAALFAPNFEASAIIHGPNRLLRFAIREKRFVFALELLTQLKKLLKLMMPRLTTRIDAHKRWMLDKTTSVFAPKPSPGPHKAKECLPLVLILRNQTQMPQLQAIEYQVGDVLEILPGRLVCYLTNGRFQALVLIMIGVPSKGCTLFSLSRVFPIGFFLVRFFKEQILLDLLRSYYVAACLWDARWISCGRAVGRLKGGKNKTTPQTSVSNIVCGFMESGDQLNQREGIKMTDGEELLGDVAARMASLKGQDAGNMNKQRVNDEVAGKNTRDHIGVSSYADRVAPTPIVAPTVINASHDDVFGATYKVSTVAPTSFGDFYTMNPSSDHVMDIEEHAWSFNHADPNNNSNNLSSFGAAYPKPFDGPLLMNETNLGVNANSGDTSLGQTNKTNVPSYDSLVVQSVDINMNPTSYARVAGVGTKDQKKFNQISIHWWQKRIAFLVVEYYAGNNWAKHGLKRIMMNDKEVDYEHKLAKRRADSYSIWVKLHDVPIQVFKKDGISLIATYLGKPIMLESYASSICKDSWGRSSFARCLIEINSEAEFKDSITIGIPDLDGPGYTKETIRVEYEWQPPRCPTCTIFGHTRESCPKKVVSNLVVNDTNATNDGFQKVVNMKCNNKGSSVGNKIPKGVLVSKGFQVGKDFAFKPKASNVGSNGDNGTRGETSFKAVDDDEEKEVKNVWDESENLNLRHTWATLLLRRFLMFSIASWNIRGLNRSPKQKEVHQVVNENNLSVCAILESHVDVAIIYDTCKKVCKRWKWTSNGSLCPKGTRIILGWNDDLVDVMSMVQTNQVMHVQDHSCGGYEPDIDMREFKECVQLIDVMDVNATEAFHDVVTTGWNLNVHGCAMYQVVKRLKGLKTHLRKLLPNQGNLHDRVNHLCMELDEAQKAIDRNPSCSLLRDEHAHYLLAFKEASLDE